MSYLFPKRCRDYFKYTKYNVSGKSRLIDDYILCLYVGLKFGKLGNSEELKGNPEILRTIPHDYVSNRTKEIITALLINTELKRKKIDLEDKAEVKKRVRAILGQNITDDFSESGFLLLNRYALGGFDIISKELGDRPTNSSESTERFFMKYIDLMTK